jgi:hypothetical protein
VAADREQVRQQREQRGRPPAAHPQREAGHAEHRHEQAVVEAHQPRHPRRIVERSTAELRHAAADRAEEVREEHLERTEERHAPRDRVLVDHAAGAAGVPLEIEGRDQLHRRDRERGRDDERESRHPPRCQVCAQQQDDRAAKNRRLQHDRRLRGQQHRRERQRSQRAVAPPSALHVCAGEQDDERPPRHRPQRRDDVRQSEESAPESERQGANEAGLDAERHPAQERVHAARRQHHVGDDLELEPERERRQEHEPGGRIEELEGRIGRQRLPRRELPRPHRKLPLQQRVAHDPRARQEPHRHVAEEKAAAEKEDVGEHRHRTSGQEQEGQAVRPSSAHGEEAYRSRGRRGED